MWFFIVLFLVIVAGMVGAHYLYERKMNTEEKQDMEQIETYLQKQNLRPILPDSFNKAKSKYRSLKRKENWGFSEIEKSKFDAKKTFSGIYSIYYENQNEETIIPIFIGKSKDLHLTLKQHILEIKNMKKGNKNSKKYEKIREFARNNNLTEKDLKFAVLKKTDVKNLDKEETKYIREFRADIYGFNAKE